LSITSAPHIARLFAEHYVGKRSEDVTITSRNRMAVNYLPHGGNSWPQTYNRLRIFFTMGLAGVMAKC